MLISHCFVATFGVELDVKLSIRKLEENSSSAISTVQVVSLVISSSSLYFSSFVGNKAALTQIALTPSKNLKTNTN